MATAKNPPHFLVNRALRHFGFHQTLRGALILGILTGIILGTQGAAYAAAYPDKHSRDTIAASLQAVPALGFTAGETANLVLPAGYAIYKSVPTTTLIIGIWGLVVVTRLLRGQEEDGKWEAIIAGKTTSQKASWQILIGFGYSILLAYFIAFVIVAALGADPQVALAPSTSALMVAGVFLPALFFSSIGVITSQLAITRSRATFYGLVPLLVLFAIRGTANSVSDLNWLKQYTPFGWTDLLNPVLDPKIIWALPTLIIATTAITIGIYLSGKRDMGAGLIRQSTVAKSRFFLLKSPAQLALRQNLSTYVWWGIGALSITALLTAITNVAVNLVSTSPAVESLVTHAGGSLSDIKLIFLGAGGTMTAMLLLVMATIGLTAIRHEEAKSYLDNLLVQPIKRSTWLTNRLIIIVTAFTVISLLCAITMWSIAGSQGISINLSTILQNAISLVGTAVLVLGIGTLFYGFFPRLASISMYAVIIWSLVIDVLQSVLKLNDIVIKSSLFHYIQFSPAKDPDWSTLAWLVGIGIILAAIGIFNFTKRDIITE